MISQRTNRSRKASRSGTQPMFMRQLQPNGFASRKTVLAEVSAEAQCLGRITEASELEMVNSTKRVSIPKLMQTQALQIAMMTQRTNRSRRQVKGGTQPKSQRQPQPTNYGGQPSEYDSRRSTFAEVNAETQCLGRITEASKSESAKNAKQVFIPQLMSLQASNKSHKMRLEQN